MFLDLTSNYTYLPYIPMTFKRDNQIVKKETKDQNISQHPDKQRLTLNQQSRTKQSLPTQTKK